MSQRGQFPTNYVNQIVLLYTFTFIGFNRSMSNIEYDLVQVVGREETSCAIQVYYPKRVSLLL